MQENVHDQRKGSHVLPQAPAYHASGLWRVSLQGVEEIRVPGCLGTTT